MYKVNHSNNNHEKNATNPPPPTPQKKKKQKAFISIYMFPFLSVMKTKTVNI